MEIFSDVQLPQLVSTIVYSLIGLVFFALTYFIIEKITPFSVRKEIEEDQNIALGLIIGAMILGMALIIGAAILSPSDAKAPSRIPTTVQDQLPE